ncbi:MAG: VOC family protein [Thiohalocapsa sp.]
MGRDAEYFHNLVALSVTDLNGLSKRMAAAGIACRFSRSGRRALFCRDPDGNAVELIEQG